MKRVCGLDVHKDNAFVCILGENGEKIEFKTGVLTVELDSFRDRLVELGVGEVAMESTAVYWMPIWRILESDFRLYLVNPLSIKQLPGRKSDVKDAEWIAHMPAEGPYPRQLRTSACHPAAPPVQPSAVRPEQTGRLRPEQDGCCASAV